MKPICTTHELLDLLDELFAARQDKWWDDFFSKRDKPCPFFITYPDENLMEYFQSGQLTAGKVLELGCGNGRNALYFAKNGCDVDAVDFSPKAIAWALENAKREDLHVNFICDSIFALEAPPDTYDIVYDSGCFHHLAPHRRKDYVEMIARTIRDGGYFGLVCFAPEGGAGLSDLEVYQRQSLQGGLGYTQEQLYAIFSSHFDFLSIRRMVDVHPEEGEEHFGKDILWAALLQPKVLTPNK